METKKVQVNAAKLLDKFEGLFESMTLSFSSRVIAWQKQHGRHGLPWQETTDPYRVWLSEIMLQQTQVGTVIPYYRRFVERFPDLASLAEALEDDVLRQWSGLGYYSRARNLHRAAQRVMAQHGGAFPTEFDAILALPGVGRSTAAAIGALAFGQRRAILDGNVKRVLARQFGVAGYPGEAAVEEALWRHAETLLPESDVAAYTQGLMDLGATLCTRNRPACARCPVSATCVALITHRVALLPQRKPVQALPLKKTVMLIICDRGEVLLERRPPTGVWGSLWCFPEMPVGVDVRGYCEQALRLSVAPQKAYPILCHGFTHFRLAITPQPVLLSGRSPRAAEPGRIWLAVEDALQAAIPTPVRKLLMGMANGPLFTAVEPM